MKPIHLFKARKCNGGWIYGTPMYECSAGRYKLIGIIKNSQKFAIEPSTLCESFMKYDIYKNLVYTNDIVLVHDERFSLGMLLLYMKFTMTLVTVSIVLETNLKACPLQM